MYYLFASSYFVVFLAMQQQKQNFPFCTIIPTKYVFIFLHLNIFFIDTDF